MLNVGAASAALLTVAYGLGSLAGALVGIFPLLPLAAGALVTGAAVLISAAERRIDLGVSRDGTCRGGAH